MDAQISLPANLRALPTLSLGLSGLVRELSSSAVVKIPYDTPENRSQLAIERMIYERLAPHPSVTKFLSAENGMIILERLQYPLRQRLRDLQQANQATPIADVLRWAHQITQGLQHVHAPWSVAG